jgi:hypothetical protein
MRRLNIKTSWCGLPPRPPTVDSTVPPVAKIGNASMNSSTKEQSRFILSLQNQLKSLQLCTSDEEASAIAEALVAQELFEASSEYLTKVADAFRDYFEDELSRIDAMSVVRDAAICCWGEDVQMLAFIGLPKMEDSDDASNEDEGSSSHGEYDDDGEFIGEGECELCEREIKLTRHHLIPKSTHPRMKKKLWHAASAIESYHSETNLEKQMVLREKLQKTLGISNIEDLPATISHPSIRNYLFQISSICRPCHSAIHRIHSEWELATEYNTTERLLECDEVRKFAKWANKQRPGKYSVK